MTSNSGTIRKDVVMLKNDVWLESIKEYLTYFTAESPDFSNVWGGSFEYRKQVSRKIKDMIETNESEIL